LRGKFRYWYLPNPDRTVSTRQSILADHHDNAGAGIAHGFIVAVLQETHPHDPALADAYILIVLPAERAGNHCGLAVRGDLTGRLNLNWSAAGDHGAHGRPFSVRRNTTLI